MSDSQQSSGSVAYKTRQSIIWYTTVPFIIHFIRFANSILLARLLSPSDFGIIGIITVILFYCDSFSDFGFGKAIIQQKEISDKHYISYFSFNILISLFFFIAAQGFSNRLSIYYQIPELADAVRVYAFLFIITALTAGPKAKLKRELNFKFLAIIEGLKVVFSMVTSLTLALLGFKFWSIIYAMLLSHAVALVLLTYTSRLIPRFSINLSPLKDLFNFGLWDFIGAQFKLIGDSADKLIIGKVLGADSLGYYDKAMGLARMPDDQISTRLSHISFSSFSRIQGDQAKLKRYFFKIVILNAVIVLPILIGLLWVSKSFILVLLGEKWLPMVPSLQIFTVSFMISSFTNPVIAMNLAIAQVKYQTIIRIVLTIALVIGLIYVTSLGIESAASVILVFNLFMFFASYTLLNIYLQFGWVQLFMNLLPPLIIVIVMVIVLYVFDNIVTIKDGFWYLLLSVIIGGMSYFIGFVIIPFKKLEFLRSRVYERMGISKNLLKY
jgi:O-antigen/teichoic acid export membrane protein